MNSAAPALKSFVEVQVYMRPPPCKVEITDTGFTCDPVRTAGPELSRGKDLHLLVLSSVSAQDPLQSLWIFMALLPHPPIRRSAPESSVPSPTIKSQQKPPLVPGARFQKSLKCINKEVTGAL